MEHRCVKSGAGSDLEKNQTFICIFSSCAAEIKKQREFYQKLGMEVPGDIKGELCNMKTHLDQRNGTAPRPHTHPPAAVFINPDRILIKLPPHHHG